MMMFQHDKSMASREAAVPFPKWPGICVGCAGHDILRLWAAGIHEICVEGPISRKCSPKYLCRTNTYITCMFPLAAPASCHGPMRHAASRHQLASNHTARHTCSGRPRKYLGNHGSRTQVAVDHRVHVCGRTLPLRASSSSGARRASRRRHFSGGRGEVRLPKFRLSIRKLLQVFSYDGHPRDQSIPLPPMDLNRRALNTTQAAI
jgi:hypothetical protein